MPNPKRTLRIALQLLSLLLFALILWWAGPEPWRQIVDSDWRLLLLALLIYGVVGVVSALRLRVVAQALAGEDIGSRRRFYYLSMTARVLGLILPRGISTLGGKSVGLRALGISLRRSLWIVLMDNLFDILTLFLATIPAVFFLQNQLGALSFAALTALLWLLLALLTWIVIASGRLTPFIGWLFSSLPWLSRRFQLDERLATHLFPRAAPAVKALGHTVVLNVLLIVNYALIARALELPVSGWLFAAAFPVTQLSLIVAVAPGGLGIFDLGWLGLLRLGGMVPDDALTFVVAQRAFIYVFVLIWAGVSALLTLTEERSKAPAPGIAPQVPARTPDIPEEKTHQ